MVNTEEFKTRLEKIRSYYDLSAAAFAETIGVQRSSISHLLSGRNKPSLDFVLKVVKRFPDVDLYWLLNGKGSFPGHTAKEIAFSDPKAEFSTPDVRSADPEIEKIVIFHRDGSFREYLPS